MAELRPEISTLANNLKNEFTVSEDKTSIVFNKDVFEKNLPEGITVKQVKEIENYKQNLAYAAGIIVGEEASKVFKANKEATKLTGTISLPVGKIAATSTRDYVSRNPQTGEETTRHNHISLAVVTKAGGNQLTAVREAAYKLADRFTK